MFKAMVLSVSILFVLFVSKCVCVFFFDKMASLFFDTETKKKKKRIAVIYETMRK